MSKQQNQERYVVQVIERATGKVVKEMTATYERRAEKILGGMSINLDHDNYTLAIVEKE